ncbi:hypothetical protein GH714_043118 [Hevea brasiliensis]|uniref:WRKY domain-containing protein n=1 Tax=Hevea brasiliensis TaxID=3981 RepID=A0A6A6K2G8_HEVBR|nr:hypothetical protein GH714_043118 [Hevea brasiliensis]
MSDEHKDLYYHASFHEDHYDVIDETGAYNSQKPLYSIAGSSTYGSSHGFDPSSYMSFTECLHGSMDYNSLAKAFGMSPSSSEPFSSIEGNPKPVEVGDLGGGGNSTENPVTPNSSVSFSSSEAGGEEDSGKVKKESPPKGSEQDGGECSKKEGKTKKKGEKKQREPRFAFMTKSEVDHLEDGYRWRKYGQKAVKNSPYPRSYYRCTTQKCTVKKRVERSFQDPSIVITTYEGQHNHPIPATLRGNAAAMFSHSMLTPAPIGTSRPTFPQDFLFHMAPHISNQVGAGAGSIYPQSLNNNQHLHHQYQVPDYGLLQDIVPSMFFKQEP